MKYAGEFSLELGKPQTNFLGILGGKSYLYGLLRDWQLPDLFETVVWFMYRLIYCLGVLYVSSAFCPYYLCDIDATVFMQEQVFVVCQNAPWILL